MTTARLLNTVALLGAATTHVSGGYPMPRDVLPILKSPGQPSTLYRST